MDKTIWKGTVVALAVALLGCGEDDDAERFVGAWSWAEGAEAQVTCGTATFPNPLEGIVETFTQSGDVLSKSDSQGCAGLEFVASGRVASLREAGQSCTIPAAGTNPSATFAPSAYTFTLGDEDRTLTADLTATYTPEGGPACSVTAEGQLLSRN